MTDLSGTHTYEYDALHRLVAASHPNLPGEAYRYDAAGNRVASVNDPGYSYDAAGRLLAGEGATYRYDKNGNLISKTTAAGTTSYTWGLANQLVRSTFPDGGYVAYKYDPFGRRIEKDVNGTVTAYLYDLSAILLELDAGGAVQARYTSGPGVDQPLMMERGDRVFFYHLDGQGNVSRLTDASGAAACSYRYDAFGRTEPCPEVVNPFAFAGREYDAESGLYYLRARYYDPAIGRFISSDPLDLAGLLMTEQDRRAGAALLPASAAALVRRAGMRPLRNPQELNSYSYALNNPAAFRDPTGLRCDIYVQIGWEPNESGGTATTEAYFSGVIHDFEGWMSRNNYTLTYTEGPYAGIVDHDTGQVVGMVSASAVGFTEVTYPEAELHMGAFWQAVGEVAWETGQDLWSNFQASLEVPWYTLSPSEWWEAANNPQNYVYPPK